MEHDSSFCVCSLQIAISFEYVATRSLSVTFTWKFSGERILEIGSRSQSYDDTINIYQYIGYIDIHFHSNTTSS